MTTPSPKRRLPKVHQSERPHLAQRGHFQRCIGPNDHTQPKEATSKGASVRMTTPSPKKHYQKIDA
ncbi:uncharacterized protein G2W53_016355 [Senna tora]|uniref:Uncharacterized protein n=1 Tax=Senna tora TaxID=362788 RepID=A0A834TQD0_9FABA|nr:uncharacterized protein G2W53_016355 [Senna tora]